MEQLKTGLGKVHLSMRLRYIYSACVVIEALDATLVTDPWFTPGVYEGSWFQYPPLGRDPVDVIGRADFIYISHIHPDHYDPRFLRKYLASFPAARIIIGETNPRHLANRMRADGFSPEIVKHLNVGGTTVDIYPSNLKGDGMDIDTALAVSHGDQSVVNLNDNLFDAALIDQLLSSCPGHRPTVALLPYSGAGGYPQCAIFDSEEELRAAAAGKRRRFIDMYGKYVSALNPKVAIPFAGKYWLGGPLGALNPWRGVPDACEVLQEYAGVTVVLGDGGSATIDLETLETNSTRTAAYDPATVQRHIQSLEIRGYDYENELQPMGRSLPLLAVLKAAVANARRTVRISQSSWICLKPRKLDQWLVFDVSAGDVLAADDVSTLSPRLEIFVDDRHLFGLLTRMYHWNNAVIGSHLRSRRVPDTYDAQVAHLLNFLHV